MTLSPTHLSILKRLLSGGNSRPLRTWLSKLTPSDIGLTLTELDARETRRLFDQLIISQRASSVLDTLPPESLKETLSCLEPKQILEIVKSSSADEAAYFYRHLGAAEQTQVLSELPSDKQEQLKLFLSYPEGSSGRLMKTRPFSVHSKLTASEAIQALRDRAKTESIYYIYCVDQEERLLGVASLRQMVAADPSTLLEVIMDTRIISVHPDTPAQQASQLVSHYDFIAIPVVDPITGVLLGIVTVDDVLDYYEDRVTAEIYASRGLREGDRVYSTAWHSFQLRLPWMVLNLGLAAMVSSMISLFEETMSQMIILATLNNIVAGIGGNTAIQSLTVVTRGLATQDFEYIKVIKAFFKELRVGLALGVVMGLLTGILVFIWKQNALVASVIAISILMNLCMAAFLGTLAPLVLKRFGKDPAVGSGVLVTMFCDLFGFFTFLGTATLALKYFGGS